MLALVTCHISPLNLIRKKINSWHLTSRLTARSLSELDRECILGKVFFPSGGGRVRVRVRRGRRQVKIEFELLWGEFEREFELCHRQFELEFEHVDRESGLRKLVFFFRGGLEFNPQKWWSRHHDGETQVSFISYGQSSYKWWISGDLMGFNDWWDLMVIYMGYLLVGGIPTPLKNMSSPVGMMTFPTEWKVIEFHGSKPTSITLLYRPTKQIK